MRPLFETGTQAYLFLVMGYCGAALGLLWDVAGLIRKKGGWRLAILDMLACLLTGVSVAIILVMTGQENLRFYSLLGMIIGWLIYDLGLRTAAREIVQALKKHKLAGEGQEKEP